MKKYIKLSTYAKLNDIKYHAAFLQFKKGLIPNTKQLATGTILVEDKDPVSSLNGSSASIPKAALYARVSSNTMKENLERQLSRLEEFSTSAGYITAFSIKEIASGLNDKRKKLETLLINNDSWDVLIVEHKDRLTRFGFNYIETLLRSLGKELIVINKQVEEKKDLMEDLISIIYSFSARMYGRRNSKKIATPIVEKLKEA